jgi:hypothetical protein
MAKPKTVRVGDVTVTQISPKERELLAEKILHPGLQPNYLGAT